MKSKSLIEAIKNKDLIEAEYWAIHDPLSLNKYKDNHSPLQMALIAGSDFVELLLKRGASVNQQDKKGWTALHFACQLSNRDEGAALLLKWGADPSLKNAHGENVIHRAICGQKEAILKLILSQGTDMTLRNSAGEDYLEYCIKYGTRDRSLVAMTSMLIDHEMPLSHLESALKMRQKYPELECFSMIEARLLALKEKEALAEVIGEIVGKTPKELDQTSMASEKNSDYSSADDSLSLSPQKPARRL